MDNKLLLVTAGTIAAGVGQEFLRQVNARSTNKKRLYTIVRSIDTTDLSGTYSGLIGGERFILGINPQHIDAIQDNIGAHSPELERILYPGSLPETTMAGGGGIRYNGAGAVLLNQSQLNGWLKNALNDLASKGDQQRNISIAIVISAVGATGSGSLEHLIEIIVKAAQEVGIATPLQCNIFILQPGTTRVTELGEANAVALYAEMAASQQDSSPTARRRYQGRTVMIGWGDRHSLSSLEQLEDVTAALIRVIHDPMTNLSAEYFQRLIDNHVLRDRDPQTGLPSHLSTATMVTINLGDLETQFIQRDVNGLLDAIVIGKQNEDEENRSSVFQNVINEYLMGNDARERYEHLLDHISKSADLLLDSSSVTPAQLRKGNTQIQAVRLRGIWESDQMKLTQALAQMKQQARTIAESLIREMKQARSQAILGGRSLSQIKHDYDHFQRISAAIQREIPRYADGDLSSHSTVETALIVLSRANPFNAGRALDNALGAVVDHLRGLRFRIGSAAATMILRALVQHCTIEISKLITVIYEAQRSINALTNDQQSFQVESKHLLHLLALADFNQVEAYYKKISLFAKKSQDEDDLFIEDELEGNSLSLFLQALKKGGQLELLFGSDITTIIDTFADYARDIIHDRMEKYSVLDVLIEQNLLDQRLSEAAVKADTLITLNKGLAPACRETRHVVAFYRDRQERALQTVIKKVFMQGECTLLKSDDPTEIVVFYYADGLPMSAVNDLTGRCLNAFLERRRQWHLHNQNGARSSRWAFRSVSVPVYSGKDAEDRVLQTETIRSLYRVRNKAVVKTYHEVDILDLQALNGNHESGDNK